MNNFRENPAVQVIGSHAAMTCHIVIMRHTESHVCSLGNYFNITTCYYDLSYAFVIILIIYSADTVLLKNFLSIDST